MATLLRLVLAVLLAMAFDMGFDYRATAGFVTDPSYAVPVLAEVYPHTYTNVDGKSINAGWATAPNPVDSSAGNDPRIAGVNYDFVQNDFQVDLSSGSAPGAGDYTLDCAVGFQSDTFTQRFQIRDTSTVLIDSGDVITASGHYIDATLSDVAATTTWTGATTVKTFATTLVVFRIRITGVITTLAHFRLTLQTPTPSGGVTGMPWWLLGPTILPGSDLMRSF